MPHPCDCRICGRMGWDTHALLAELARHLGSTQGEVLGACVRREARALGLLPHEPEPKRDPFRSAMRVALARRMGSHPSPRSASKPSNSPSGGSEPAPTSPNGYKAHKRRELSMLSKWELYWIEAARDP